MKVGDLVVLKHRGTVVKRFGIVVKVDFGRQHAPLSIPACLVHWPASGVRWEFMDSLEILSK